MKCIHGHNYKDDLISGDELFHLREEAPEENSEVNYPKDKPDWYETPFETLLEGLRLKHYPELPSREKCFFAFRCRDCALFFRDNSARNNQYYLCTVHPLSITKISNHDMPFTDASIIKNYDPKLVEEFAHAYWRKKSITDCLEKNETRPETLIYGKLKFIELEKSPVTIELEELQRKLELGELP